MDFTDDMRADQEGKVELMSAAFAGHSDVIHRLELLLSETLKVPVTHSTSQIVIPPRKNLQAYIRTRRVHASHRLQLGGKPASGWSDMIDGDMIEVFVKAGPNPVDVGLESEFNKVRMNNFRAPFFFGSFIADGLSVGVWEFTRGKRLAFEALPLETQINLVRALATMNALAKPDLPVKIKWAFEPLSWYQRRFDLMPESEQQRWAGAMQRLEALHAANTFEIEPIFGAKPDFFTHYDLNPNNAFFGDDGEIVLFDWEGAFYSVAGADLRFLTRMEERDLLLDTYIECMAELGHRLDRHLVKRAYELLEGFRMVFKGWAKGNLGPVLRGLSLVEVYLAQPATNSALSAPVDAQPDEAFDPTFEEEPDDMEAIATSDALSQTDRKIKDPSPELMEKINAYIAEKGAIYAPIDHPTLGKISSSWRDARFDVIEPHLDYKGGTALDIGSHWGYMASRLEGLGYKVTANEHSPKHLYFLEQIRDVSGRHFTVVPGNIFNMEHPDFDVIFALNIFHHFLKTDERFNNFEAFLDRTKCRMMIYQSHRSVEKPKLDTAGHYMEPDDMAQFIADHLRLPEVEKIGVDGGRNIYKISK